jgi:hypothetical protein
VSNYERTTAGRDSHAIATHAATVRADNMQQRREAEAAALPPLDSPESAMIRLQRISELAVAGIVPGSQAGAAVRAVEAWLATQRHAVSITRVRQLEARVRELEDALANARGQ